MTDSNEYTYEEEEDQKYSESEYEYNSYASDWVGSFLEHEDIDWLANPDDFFLNDDFNMNGLSHEFNNYKLLIEILRGSQPGNISYSQEVEKDVEKLFLLIHARYILTDEGIVRILGSFQEGEYGQCPRISCHGQKCIPYGMSPQPGVSCCLIYCPCCKDIYYSPNPQMRRIDGCAFGPSFAHIFERQFPEYINARKFEETPLSIKGFKLSKNNRRLIRD